MMVRMTAIQPNGPVLIATVLLFAVLAGFGGRKPRPWLDLPLAALLGLAASHLLFAPGLPRGHDTLAHLWGVWAVGREAATGDLAALWLHRIGMGTPLLQFYGPLAFYTTVPFSLAGLSPADAFKAGFLIFGALSGVTMYLAVSRWTGDRRAGLVAAAAYAFAPYRLLDAHYRAAFAETAALALLPLLFLLAGAAVREGGRRRIAGAAVVAALLILTHPISALMTALGFGVWTLAEILADRRSAVRIAARLVGVWLLGIALAGFFVLPFVEGIEHVEVRRLARGESRAFSQHGLVPGDLVERRAWDGFLPAVPKADPRNGTDKEMPFYIGLVLLALLPLGFGWRGAPRGLPWVCLAGLALPMDPVPAWLASLFPPFVAIQFPWRFLGLATFGAAALAGVAAARILDRGRERRWTLLVPGLLAALLVLDAAPYTGAADWFPAYQGLGYARRPNPDCGRRWGCWEHVPVEPPYPLRVSGLFLPPSRGTGPYGDVSLFCCAYPEFQAPSALRRGRIILARSGVGMFVGYREQKLGRLDAKPYATWRRERGRPRPRSFRRGGGEIVVELDGRPGNVVVLEEYLPGWQVLAGDGWREVEPTRAGLLQGWAAAGQKEVRFRYDRWTRPRILGCLLTVLTAAGLLILGRKR